MPLPLAIPLAVAGLSAIGKTGVGIGQLLHARDEPVRPLFDIQEEYFTNRDIAARQAGSGLTDASKDYYTDQAGRGLQASASAILQAGGNANDIAAAMDQYQQGIRSVAVEDSERQQKNIESYIDRNDALAKQKVQQWVINQYEPYKDKAKANAQEKAAGLQNIFSGVSDATSALSSFSMAGNYDDLLRDPSRRAPAEEGRPATASTTYYQDKPSSAYADFVDPFDVTPVAERRTQVQRELSSNGFDPTIFSDELQEYYKRLYNF